MFGLGQTSAFAFSDNDTVNDGSDTDPAGVDILTLTVTSDGDAGSSGQITVAMVLQGPPISRAKYRVHYDYEGDTVEDHTPGDNGCEAGVNGTTSDDTSKVAIRNSSEKFTGPGKDNGGTTVSGSTITFVVEYDELGLSAGEDVIIWADTHLTGNPTFRGIRDRAPNTSTAGGDTCAKPESLDETLEITLDAPG